MDHKDDDLSDDGKRVDNVVANLAEPSKERKDGEKMDYAGSNETECNKDGEKPVNVEASSNGLLKAGLKQDNVWSNEEASSKWRMDLGIPDTVWAFNVAGPSSKGPNDDGALQQPIELQPKDVNNTNGSNEQVGENKDTPLNSDEQVLAIGVSKLALDGSLQPTNPESTNDKSLDELANEILEMIGAYFSVDCLMNSIPLLNSKWGELQNLIARKKHHLMVLPAKDSVLTEPFLKVFGKYSGLKLHKPVYSSVNSQNLDLLPDYGDMTVLNLAKSKFPNIKSVSVMAYSFQDTSRNNKFVPLIGCWPELVELRMIGYRYNKQTGIDEDWWIEVSDKINRTLKGLKHLTLFSREENSVLDVNRLSALAQLESLYLGSFGVNLARLESIRRLGLWHMAGNEWVGQLADMKKDVAGRITELTIFPSIDQLALPYVDIIGEKFLSLEYLYIRTRLPLNQVLAPLAKLTKLKNLRIWNRQVAPLSYIDPTELESLQPLDSVEQLQLNIRLVTHNQLDWIPRLFPNLKWIKLDWFVTYCKECGDMKVVETREKCEDFIMAPLKQCAQLRRIYLDYYRMKMERCAMEHLTNSWYEMAPSDLV